MAKILVVDDSDLERLAMSDILRKAGHTVIEAENGEKGVAAAQLHMPSAIMMDIVMPVMEGFRALKRLKMDEATKNIPVVMVSSKSQESDKFRAEQLGASGYVIKPATAASVLPVIKQLI